MDTKDLILEIGTEEIPSGYFHHILKLLSFEEEAIRNLFESQNIKITNARAYSTPRRIILHIENIPVSQDIIVEGPPVRIAYDESKKPTRALLAFLEKNNVSLDDIKAIEGSEERVRIKREGVLNKDILSGILPKVISSLDFPKTMRWENEGFLFARPIRWILAMLGSEVIGFNVAGIASSNVTYGHRFLGHNAIKVRNASSYFKALDKNHVIWDNEKRKTKILSFLEKKRWHENSSLLDEVNNLVEFPYPVEGIFKSEYLKIPNEVLLASMAKHQRVFCLEDKNGALTNRFVAVLNGNYKNRKQILKNFDNVLDARLKDALFFYESDVAKPISEWQKGLSGVVFHKKLGTLKDKIERLKKIAQFLEKQIDSGSADKEKLLRAISLLKADLLTHMVREFPSLQGVMGKYYALESGEDEEVAAAIGEHYLPRFADDHIPKSELGTICSLADKLDNIICYFKIGKFPKGSWDLYALRRQGIGIISILLKDEISISISSVYDYLYNIAPGDYDEVKLKKVFLDFFKDRFVHFIKARYGYKYDLIDAVTASGTDDIYNSYLKLESLNSIIDEVCFEDARCVVERTHNIIKASKQAPVDVKSSLLEEPEERELYNKYKGVREEFKRLASQCKYDKATRLYSESLSKITHDFFDKVMVNVDKKDIRLNRLGLLSAINSLYVDNIADLSKIVVDSK